MTDPSGGRRPSVSISRSPWPTRPFYIRDGLTMSLYNAFLNGFNRASALHIHLSIDLNLMRFLKMNISSWYWHYSLQIRGIANDSLNRSVDQTNRHTLLDGEARRIERIECSGTTQPLENESSDGWDCETLFASAAIILRRANRRRKRDDFPGLSLIFFSRASTLAQLYGQGRYPRHLSRKKGGVIARRQRRHSTFSQSNTKRQGRKKIEIFHSVPIRKEAFYGRPHLPRGG